MKIKDGFMIRKIVGEWIVVATGKDAAKFDAVINLTQTSCLIWRMLEEGTDRDKIIRTLTVEYELYPEDAVEEVDKFLSTLRDNRILIG